jgi:hypothetical protein
VPLKEISNVALLHHSCSCKPDRQPARRRGQKDGEQKDGEQKDGEQKDGEQKDGEQKDGEQKAPDDGVPSFGLEGVLPSDLMDSETDSRFRPVFHAELNSLVIPSLVWEGQNAPKPSLSSAFVGQIGVGARLWEGYAGLRDAPWQEFRIGAYPDASIAAGFRVQYEGVEAFVEDERYALQMGGYLGFFTITDSDRDRYEEKGMKDWFAGSEGIMVILSKRRLMDSELSIIEGIPFQYCLEFQRSSSLTNSIALTTYSTLAPEKEEMPRRAGFGLGLNLLQ